MLSYDRVSMVYDTFAQQTDQFQGQSSVLLASRIIATTPGAVPCPSCDDAVRRQATSPNDPTCLGGGYLIPGPSGANDPATVRGYLAPVPFEATVLRGQSTEQMTPFGIQQSTVDVAIWPDQALDPKRGDVLIVADPLARDNHTDRYLVQDALDAETLGAAVLLHRATVALQRRESAVYSIPSADTTSRTPGTWS